ncbi:MAG: SRPBCC family protein, partial [Actinomycetota bacterium]
APPSRVWELLADWEGSAKWMVDATTVEVIGNQRTGVGTKIRAVTRIAGIPIEDRMRVVTWDEGRLISVMHVGWPICGLAWFEILPRGAGTWFEWSEELDPPLGPLGELGGLILRRPIERVLRKSALKLKQLAEAGRP